MKFSTFLVSFWLDCFWANIRCILNEYLFIYLHLHCATGRKIAGSIPDGIIGTFLWLNLSGRTMNLGLNQSLTEMSTRGILREIKAAGAQGWQPYQLRMLIFLKLWEPQPPGAQRACPDLSSEIFNFYIHVYKHRYTYTYIYIYSHTSR